MALIAIGAGAGRASARRARGAQCGGGRRRWRAEGGSQRGSLEPDAGRRRRRPGPRRGPVDRTRPRRGRSAFAAAACGSTRPGRSARAANGDGGYGAELATNDPAGRTIEVRLRPAADGVIGLDADGPWPGPADRGDRDGLRRPRRTSATWASASARRRSTSAATWSRTTSPTGPISRDEWGLIESIVPPWGFRPREDATYYPVPWLLSTAGYGVLVDNPETSYFRLDQGGSWSVEVVSAPPDELRRRRPRPSPAT